MSLPISMFKISMMLSQNAVGAIFETEHISPSLMCCEIQGVSLSLSLATSWNKGGSYLVTDQTV